MSTAELAGIKVTVHSFQIDLGDFAGGGLVWRRDDGTSDD